MITSRNSWVLLIAFALASAVFAALRVPFDDEWFSLTLLTEASDAGFWASLAQDMHPPWLAMLDRTTWSLWPDRFPLHLMRALACAGAAGLWLSLLRPVTGRRTWLFAFALLHPIVFYYGGALRWYPLLLLAHALRHWAILSDATGRRRPLAFVSGAALGLASGYVDALFLVHDAAHYAWRERARPKAAALVISVAALVAVALVIGSPIASEHWAVFTHQAGKSWPALNILLWGGLGPVGEALPHGVFLFLGLVVCVAAVRGGLCLLRAGVRGQAGWLVVSLAGCWLVATRFGIWSPRYSLELWWLMSLAVLAPLVLGEGRRVLAGVSAAAVLFGLLCTLSGNMFFKVDLNDPPDTFCEDVSGGEVIDAYVIPYRRISEQLRAACAPEAELIDPPAMDHITTLDQLLAGVRARVARGGRLTLLAITSQAGIRHTRAAVREVLDDQCTVLRARPLWPPAHPWMREHLSDSPPHRLIATDYTCP